MIVFENWIIRAQEEKPLRQFDHLTDTLVVAGELPSGWVWEMLVENAGNLDILPLEPVEGGVGIVLTAQHLGVSGLCLIQLRGKSGEQVRHTNRLWLYVEASLSGDVHWPEIPTAFSALEGRLLEMVQQAQSFASHPPVIGADGSWLTWDGSDYVDSGKPSRGEVGPGYELTSDDRNELVTLVLAALPNGDEVRY